MVRSVEVAAPCPVPCVCIERRSRAPEDFRGVAGGGDHAGWCAPPRRLKERGTFGWCIHPPWRRPVFPAARDRPPTFRVRQAFVIPLDSVVFFLQRPSRARFAGIEPDSRRSAAVRLRCDWMRSAGRAGGPAGASNDLTPFACARHSVLEFCLLRLGRCVVLPRGTLQLTRSRYWSPLRGRSAPAAR